MGSNRYGTVAASVTEETEPMWARFRATARRLGMTKTKALERAVALWLDTVDAPGTDPFTTPPPPPAGDTESSANPFA